MTAEILGGLRCGFLKCAADTGGTVKVSQTAHAALASLPKVKFGNA